jgi:uncharacterized iron-regulated membrane protein
MMKLLHLRTWYKIHKWTAIVTGLALVMWLVTGLAMNWERLFPYPQHTPAIIDIQAATLSPAEAVARLDQALGESPEIAWVTVRPLLNKVVYEIETGQGHIYLIDAAGGELFEITPELAGQLAVAAMPNPAPIGGVDRVDRNTIAYFFGPVPAYRVTFADSAGTRAYVAIAPNPIWNARTGEVHFDTRWSRARGLLESMHTFVSLRVITDKGRVITLLLWLATLATLFMALVGFYLALPQRWQFLATQKQPARRRNRQKGEVSP